MFRKILWFLIVTIVWALVLTGIDGVRHARALRHLEARHAIFDDWHFRIVGGEALAPAHEERGLRARWQAMVAVPGYVGLEQTTLDEPTVRNLALIRMGSLAVTECRGLSPALMTEVSRITSIHWFVSNDSDLTDEGLCLLWSGLPDLETAVVRSDRIGADGFRTIGHARKLRELILGGRGITDQVIAQVSAAPAVQSLALDHAAVTEACAPFLAGMPPLRSVGWITPELDAVLVKRLKALNPKLQLPDVGPPPSKP